MRRKCEEAAPTDRNGEVFDSLRACHTCWIDYICVCSIRRRKCIQSGPSSRYNNQLFGGHLESDPRFITYIERNGPCTVPGPPRDTAHLIVPYQLYPAESVQRQEEGTVVMEFIFDSGWCVRKVTIVKSSKYWRLDYVSLKWAMNLRWAPKKTLFTADGEPMVTIPIGWGKSQTKELKSVHIKPAQSSTQGN